MIISLAGRRIDALDATQPRFPLARATLVRERISTLLIDRKATDLVCSAACGTDLLALDAAGDLGIQRHIVLPFEPNRFRATSVTDRPGEWGALFDQITKEVQAAGKLTILSGEGDDDAIFATTNQVMLNEALTLAQRATSNRGEPPANSVLAVLVWDGQSRGEGDITVNFADAARVRGIPILEIMTTK